MKTISATDEAYKKVMATKRVMEKETNKVISMAEALDELLKIYDEDGKWVK